MAIGASALAGVPAGAFVAGLSIGNAVFIAAHFGLGYVVGEPILAAAGSLLGPLTIAGIGLAIAGAVGWVVIRRRSADGREDPLSTAVAWTDACCPACLTLAVVDQARS